MDRNRHSERNENVSRFETLNEVDSLLEELKKSVADENIGASARKSSLKTHAEQDNTERFKRTERSGISKRDFELPQPGKRLQSLLNRGDFVRRDSHNSDFLARISRLEMVREALPNVENNSGGAPEIIKQPDVRPDAKPDVKPEIKPISEMKLARPVEPSQKPVGRKTWKRMLIGTEISIGALLGMGLVAGVFSMRYPVEKRLFQEFQQSASAVISCDEVENNLLRTAMTFGPLTACATQENERFADISVQRTDFQLSAISQFRPVLGIRSVTMEGVEFPNLAQPALRDSWRPEPIAPLFSDEVKETLATRSQSLESLRFLEEVKEKYLPIYQEISAETTRISANVETQEKKMLAQLGVKELTPDALKSEAFKRREMVAEVEKLGKLRQEAIDIQARWMTLNQDVATDLAKIREKIAEDGKAFSTILQYELPTESTLSEFLFRTDVRRRLAETLNWATAVSRLAEMGTMTGARKQADKLCADGVIELFGQSFAFNGDWETNIEEDCEYSYRGNLRLNSNYLPEELLRDAFMTVACRKKSNSVLRTLTARIPVMNDTFVWGDYKSLPIYGRFQEGAVVLDLTLFGEEIRGKISLEMNRVSFNATDVPAEKSQILKAKIDGQELPAVNIDATISGTLSEPKIECNSAFSQEFLPAWEAAMQEIHQTTRKEIIASIYEQLKNAETAFNGALEPFYQEILVCAQKTDVFRRVPDLKGKGEPQLVQNKPQREAVVDITPMNLAHLDVKQEDWEENLPVYNPNIGMTPMPSVPVVAVGSQAKEYGNPVEKETVKVTVPVKKVTKIEPIVVDSAPMSATAAEPTPSVASPPMPNVAEPVMYSRPEKPLVPIDVPSSGAKKKAMPLPIGKSTSQLGS